MQLLSSGQLEQNRLYMNDDNEISITREMAYDLEVKCDKRQNRVFMEDYLKRVSALIKQQIRREIMERHYIYYVQSEGECIRNDQNLASLFMFTDRMSPDNIDFNNGQQKLLFLKVCERGRDEQMYLLRNCAFDSCSETSKEQDKEMSTTTFYDQQKQQPKQGNCAVEINQSQPLWVAFNSFHKIDLHQHQVLPLGRLYYI